MCGDVCMSEALFTAITQYHRERKTSYCTPALFHGGVTPGRGVTSFKKNNSFCVKKTPS